MSAHPAAEQLSALLDQELPEAVRSSLEGHLAECDACAAHLAELASVDEAARSLPLEVPAGYFDDFSARVRGRLSARPKRRAMPVWTWAAAAALLLAVVTPLAMRERAAQAPAPVVMRDEAAPAGAAAPAAGPPASAAKPQAAPSEGEGMGEAKRGLEVAPGQRANQLEQHDRLRRRDQAVDSASAPGLQASQDKRETASALPPSAPAPPPARLEERAVDRAAGFTRAPAPAASSQRPHGPYGQQQVAPAPSAPVPEPATMETEAAAEVSAAEIAGFDADLAKEKDDQAVRQKRGASGGAEAAKLGATSGSVMKAAPPPARTGDEARSRREVYRRMALRDPDNPAADEARVGAIAEGVRAYQLDRRPEDRALAERDARAYLARRDAVQAARVRALLKELEDVGG